jgi:hypothetical protein
VTRCHAGDSGAAPGRPSSTGREAIRTARAAHGLPARARQILDERRAGPRAGAAALRSSYPSRRRGRRRVRRRLPCVLRQGERRGCLSRTYGERRWLALPIAMSYAAARR